MSDTTPQYTFSQSVTPDSLWPGQFFAHKGDIYEVKAVQTDRKRGRVKVHTAGGPIFSLPSGVAVKVYRTREVVG